MSQQTIDTITAMDGLASAAARTAAVSLMQHPALAATSPEARACYGAIDLRWPDRRIRVRPDGAVLDLDAADRAASRTADYVASVVGA